MKTSGDLHYIELRSGGYEVVREWWIEHHLLVGCAFRIEHEGRTLALVSELGRCDVFPGYRYDGPSDPFVKIGLAPLTAAFLKGACPHDVVYQGLRMGHLPPEFRARGDVVLRDTCEYFGMSHIRANLVYCGVRLFGAGAARRRPEIEDEEHIA